jgi:MFS family permease
MAFTPAFLMKTYHLSATQTGLGFGLLSAGLGIVGPMIAGPLSDRLHRWMPSRGRVWVVLFALGLSPLLGLWTYRAPDLGSFYLRFTLYSLTLTMWLPPLYAVLYDQVLPRMRAMTVATYFVLMTIVGLGIGPYAVGLISDMNGGDLGHAIRAINWVAVPIIVLLLVLVRRCARDEAGVIARARAAGEPV